ncbi:hypothetical protein RSAG8_08214, partial [Rhizoctonia solani AG-8 WAC10335]
MGVDNMLPKDCHENQAILLSQATECLAKAAMALSEAAEAMAAAAKSFIPGITSTVSESQPTEIAQTNTVISAIVDYESDSDSSPTNENLATPTKPTNNAHGKQHKNSESTRIAGEGSILDTDDEEYLSAQSTLRATQNNGSLTVATRPPTADDTPGAETETQPPPPSYRILLEDEADVLLAACSLIRRGRKVVCYVRSSITALDVYETLDSVSPTKVEGPGIFGHGFYADKQQITNHQAKNNVFVAYSEDKDIYPSSSGILTHAQPWPHGELILKEACTTLRPAFNKKLAEIPAKIKAKVYPDWITLHGMRGPYHPPSWTATTLVYRANLYLLDAFRYNAGASDDSSGIQIALPTVSAGFVTSQKLESAVEEGVLWVKSSSGLNHISSLPRDAIPAGTLSLNEAVSSKPLSNPSLQPAPAPAPRPNVTPSWSLEPETAWGGLNTPSLTQTPPRSASRISSIADSDRNRLSDRATEYLIIEKDLDAIPTICHLSMQPNPKNVIYYPKNVICFVKSLGTFEPLAGMLEKMVAKPVFPVRGNGPLSKGVKEALDSSSGCLLLCDMYSDRPLGLKNKPIDFIIHLGWVDNLLIYRGQTQQANNTVILLRREVQGQLTANLSRAGVSPASVLNKRRYNRQTEDSILAPGRKQWNELLSSNTSAQALRSAYVAWITHHYHGRHKEPEWTAVDVATQANKYFKGVFRCGNDGDGFQSRPVVTQGFVKHLGLEAAVAAGLLTMKE